MKYENAYEGFERWGDLLEDVESIFYSEPFDSISGEWKGTFKLTIEFVPEEGDIK